MRLTPAQVDELKRLAREPQYTFGGSRARVQNNLRRLGLARIGCDLCEITDAGRAEFAAQSSRTGRRS